MPSVCRRCDRVTEELYRVTTKHQGAVLLNLLVCLSCARQAKSLGLSTVKVESVKKAGKTKRVVVPAMN